MGISLKAGEKIPLSLLLENRAIDRVVRARIYNEFGVEVSGSPVDVGHLADGLYFDNSFPMPNTANILVDYDVFDGPLFTNLSDDLFPDVERFDLDNLDTAIDQLISASRQTDLTGEITDLDQLRGEITDGEELSGEVIDDNDFEIIIKDQDGLTGVVDNDNDLSGEIDC